MLLEFRASNYKSFGSEMLFSMIKAKRMQELIYSVTEEKLGRKSEKVLCSSVIYGANASGKTNIISAIETFKRIILRGNIRNAEIENPNYASGRLELIPNTELKEPKPVCFSIVFSQDQIKVQYSIQILLGSFLEPEYSRKILYEDLKVNDQTVFIRKEDTLEEINIKPISSYIKDTASGDSTNVIRKVAAASLTEDELFLENGFKTIYSSRFIAFINTWFSKKLHVIFQGNRVETYLESIDGVKASKNEVLIPKQLDEMAQLFGMTGHDLGYARDNEGNRFLASVIENNGKEIIIPADSFESYGTVRLAHLFPLIKDAIDSGGTLIIDEFDASIHPMALMNLVQIFHNDEININHAQLIFNTHNPIFLNRNLFRRDEIKLVDKDIQTGFSECYRLSDFGTSGNNAVRLSDNYMQKYLSSTYGATCEVDFSDIFDQSKKEA